LIYISWYESIYKNKLLVRISNIMPDAYTSQVIKIAKNNITKDSTLVDIGCGDGKTLQRLSKNTKLLIGIDKHIEEHNDGNIIFKVSNLENPINLEDNFADLVVCTEVLEHIKNDKRLFSEIVRITKPKGIIIISTPNKDFLKDKVDSKILKQQGHVRIGYSRQDFIQLAKKHGLSIIRFESRCKSEKMLKFGNFMGSNFESFTIIFLTPLFRILSYFHRFFDSRKNGNGADLLIVFQKSKG